MDLDFDPVLVECHQMAGKDGEDSICFVSEHGSSRIRRWLRSQFGKLKAAVL